MTHRFYSGEGFVCYKKRTDILQALFFELLRHPYYHYDPRDNGFIYADLQLTDEAYGYHWRHVRSRLSDIAERLNLIVDSDIPMRYLILNLAMYYAGLNHRENLEAFKEATKSALSKINFDREDSPVDLNDLLYLSTILDDGHHLQFIEMIGTDLCGCEILSYFSSEICLVSNQGSALENLHEISKALADDETDAVVDFLYTDIDRILNSITRPIIKAEVREKLIQRLTRSSD